jgi:hypothetical protein
MLGVDEGGNAAVALRLGDYMQGQGRLSRALRSEYLDDPAARHPTDAEGDIEGKSTGRDRFDIPNRAFAHFHDGAGAELLFDLRHGHVEGFVLLHLVSLSCLLLRLLPEGTSRL